MSHYLVVRGNSNVEKIRGRRSGFDGRVERNKRSEERIGGQEWARNRSDQCREQIRNVELVSGDGNYNS